MAAALPFISVGLGLLGLGGQVSAAGQARKIGGMNYERIMEETEEELRITEMKQEQTLGTSKSRIAASGIKMTGSPEQYLEHMSSEFEKQREWIGKAGKQRAEIAKQSGEYQSSQAMAGAFGSGAQIAGQAYNWWG